MHLATAYAQSTAVNIGYSVFRKQRENTQCSAQTPVSSLFSAAPQQEAGVKWRPSPPHLSHTASPLEKKKKEKGEAHQKARLTLT